MVASIQKPVMEILGRPRILLLLRFCGGCGRQNKSVVVVAVEQRRPGKPGQKPIPSFAVLRVVPDAAAAALEGFLKAKVWPGSHILTDGWNGHRD